MQKLSKEKREEVVRRYLSGESATKLKDEFGYTAVSSVTKLVTCRGFKTRTAKESHPAKADETVFDAVTEESAYWVGFLMADGNVNRDGQVITLSLQQRDKDHVEAFRRFLKAENPVRIRMSSGCGLVKKKFSNAMFSVSSTRLREALARFGVVPNKSLTAKVTGLEFNRDFWRGLVDGDGSIGVGVAKSGQPNYRFSLNGSFAMLSQFSEFVRTVCPNHRLNVFPVGNVGMFSTADLTARKIVNALYGGCTVALPRKLKIARKFIEAGTADRRNPANRIVA